MRDLSKFERGRELHKSNIHDRAVILKNFITESITQMRRIWRHDHKTWDLRQLETRA
jgi:hypothetical protein